VNTPAKGRLPVPDKEAIAALPPFERLGVDQVRLVRTAEEAEAAWQALHREEALGFDTESKPTFFKDQVSDGPHIVQLATARTAYVFQLFDAQCRSRAAQLMADPGIVKAGFGLGDDKKRILQKLGVEPQAVLDLNHVMHQRGWRKDMGVKAAVAVLFGRSFAKSKKAATSNWAQPRLSESQLLYAANDAWGALRVYQALGLG
jgi:ribonuclease D